MDSTFYDSLEQSTSENWYQLTTTKEGYFTITFNPSVTHNYGWDMYLYDDSFNKIKYYQGIKLNFVSDRIMFEKDTTFYLKIKGYYTSDWCPVGIDYSITTKQVNKSNCEKESNATTSKANKLSSGTPRYGTMWKDDDVDYYSFKVTKNGYTTFKFAFEDNTIVKFGWNISFLDEQGNTIYTRENVINDYISRRFNFRKGTTVYIKISGRYSNNWCPIDVKYSITPIEKASSTWESEQNNTVKKATKLSTYIWNHICKQ